MAIRRHRCADVRKAVGELAKRVIGRDPRREDGHDDEQQDEQHRAQRDRVVQQALAGAPPEARRTQHYRLGTYQVGGNLVLGQVDHSDPPVLERDMNTT